MSEYISPISTPLVTSASVKPQSSMDVLDGDLRGHGPALAVLVSHFGGDLGFARAAVERIDDRGVFLRDDAPAQLARARDLGVVGVEILGEQQEAAHARRAEQAQVAFLDLGADQAAHLGLLRKVLVAAVGDALPLGPAAH